MALIKFFMPQVWHLFEGDVYLKVGLDKELYQLPYIFFIFRIKLTELTFLDFDYIRAAARIRGRQLFE